MIRFRDYTSSGKLPGSFFEHFILGLIEADFSFRILFLTMKTGTRRKSPWEVIEQHSLQRSACQKEKKRDEAGERKNNGIS